MEVKMEVTFLETKKGNGFKIVVNGQWLYTSKKELLRAVFKQKACKFREYEEFAKAEEETNAN